MVSESDQRWGDDRRRGEPGGEIAAPSRHRRRRAYAGNPSLRT